MKRIYLDYSATTPMDKRVFEAMQPFFAKKFGNPGSLHSFGQEADTAIFESRRSIAEALGCDYSELIFTGSATEANNLALRGVLERAKKEGIKKAKVLISAIEHESVEATAEALSVELVKIPVSKAGRLDLHKLEKEIDRNTVLVSMVYANNEVGVIQDLKKITQIIKRKRGEGKYPLFHSDCVQAFQYLPCKVDELGLDLMTLSAHKIYGPKGLGLLYVRGLRIGSEDMLEPIIFGGGQELSLRSGTENTAGIVGFAKAVELSEKFREKEKKRVEELRDWLLRKLLKVFEGASVNGSKGKNQRLPNNININLKNITSEQALTYLDLKGLAISAGAACSARSLLASKTLLAMGASEESAKSSIRISLGRMTSKAELIKAVKIFEGMKKDLF